MALSCFGCNPANPDRFGWHDADGSVLQFPARFEGPPGTVNGGAAVGALGCLALEAASREGMRFPVVTRTRGRLHRAVPHSRVLRGSAKRDGSSYAVSLREADAEILSGSVEIMTQSGPLKPGAEIADAADAVASLEEMAAVKRPDAPPFFEVTGDHPIPRCFSCGPANAEGLQIFPRVANHGVTWANWTPDPALVDTHGGLAASIIAAALDCSSGICLPLEAQQQLLREDQFYLLGSLDVRYLRIAPVDAPGYHVIGRMGERDGRKFFGMSALFDSHGTAYAYADAVWIIVKAKRSDVLGPAIPS